MIKLLTIGLAAAALGACIGQLHNAQAAPLEHDAQTWQLVQFFAGEAFVMDHGLTHDDCDDAKPADQPSKGLRFACEVEG